MHRPSTTAHLVRGRRQHGAATLVVVMVLFFLAALTAAYASRNLIFEQRTAANQYRATQSFEAAEAGIEWALSLLNSGRIDAACQPTTNTAFNTFRDRVLVTDNATGAVTRRPHSDGVSRLWSACSLDAAGNWTCRCPTGDLPTTGVPVGEAAFAVRFVSVTTRPGTVRIEVNGCNGYDPACLTVAPAADSDLCGSTQCALLSLHSAARSTPTAAITSRDAVSYTTSPGTVVNTDVASGGVTLHSRLAHASVPTLHSVPGTPPEKSKIENDAALKAICLEASFQRCATEPADLGDERWRRGFFTAVFGLRPDTYRNQPAALRVDCSSTCGASEVNDARAAGRGAVVWLSGAGGLTLDDVADQIGSDTDPVVLVIEGPLAVTASAQVHGLIYAASAALQSGDIRGALVSEGAVTVDAPAQVVFDAAVLDRLRLTAGSFVRVPGSWRDFP